MAKYNPFFERAGMVRVDYRREKNVVDSKIGSFLEEHRFDFKLAKSKAYYRSFFTN
jgi:hypothetical protein